MLILYLVAITFPMVGVGNSNNSIPNGRRGK